MHSKQKGNIGQSATIKELHKLGYNVFIEVGDYSKIDLIAEKDGKLIRFQIKYVTENDGFIVLPLKKSGPNGYRYTYSEKDADLFSVYLPSQDKVIFIPFSIACQNKKEFRIRYQASKNNNTEKCHFVSEFENLQQILDRDHSSTGRAAAL